MTSSTLGNALAPRPLRQRPIVINVLVWTAFGLLQAATWLLSPLGDPNALPLIGIALFNAYMWALLTPFIFRLAVKVSAAERKLGWAVIVLLLGIVVAAAVSIVASSIHGGLPWSEASPQRRQMAMWALSRWYFEEVVLFFLVFGAGVAAEMIRKYRAGEREAARLKVQATQHETERAELNARLAQAHLAVLRAQLNPHFLFNTLNAVSALVVTDPTGVRNMIALLSELLRAALTDADEEEITVQKEMDLLRLYLEILEIRYQGDLRSRIVVSIEARDALLPRMILQPLVENAMKHGVALAGGNGLIEIRADRSGDDLLLSVRDTGGGNIGHTSTTEGAGVGLRLTRERLSELYGSDHSLELAADSYGGTTARITLPFHTLEHVRQSVEAKP